MECGLRFHLAVFSLYISCRDIFERLPIYSHLTKGKHMKPSAISTAFGLLIAASAYGSPEVYTNPEVFAANAALNDFRLTTIDFDEREITPVNGTISGRVPFEPGSYGDLGVTFHAPQGQDLFVAPGGLDWNETNSLSVGRFPSDPFYPRENDDDLVIVFETPVSVVGFEIIENIPGNDNEYIDFLDEKNEIVIRVSMPPDYCSLRAFVGVISQKNPIKKVIVSEAANDNDDIAYDSFQFSMTGCYKQGIYTDPDEFKNAVRCFTETIIDFEEIDSRDEQTTYKNAVKIDEERYAELGLSFRDPRSQGLYIAAGGSYWNESNSLSIGRFPNDPAYPKYHDDDLVLVLDPPVAAIGITIVESINAPEESIAFLDSNKQLINEVPFPEENTSYRSFIGIVSGSQKIAEVVLNESPSDNDDIAIDDIVLYRDQVEPSTGGSVESLLDTHKHSEKKDRFSSALPFGRNQEFLYNSRGQQIRTGRSVEPKPGVYIIQTKTGSKRGYTRQILTR